MANCSTDEEHATVKNLTVDNSQPSSKQQETMFTNDHGRSIVVLSRSFESLVFVLRKSTEMAVTSRKPKLPPVDKIFPLRELGKKLPEKLGYQAVRKWAVEGRTSRTGKTVKLQTWIMPYGIGTSWDDYERFIEDLQS